MRSCKIKLMITAIACMLLLCSCGGGLGHSHAYGEWEISSHPTCTEAGVFIRTCECGKTDTQSIGALGHSYDTGTVVIPPTCTDPGQINYTCRLCGAVSREKTGTLPHELTGDYLIYRTYHTRQCTACLKYEKKEEHFFSAEDNICLDCGYDPQSVNCFEFMLGEDESFYIIHGLADKSLCDVIIPESIDGIPVREIADGAFRNCEGMMNVTIPSSIQKIGEDAFFACDSLASITFLGSVEQWVEIEFGNQHADPTYYTPNIKFG